MESRVHPLLGGAESRRPLRPARLASASRFAPASRLSARTWSSEPVIGGGSGAPAAPLDRLRCDGSEHRLEDASSSSSSGSQVAGGWGLSDVGSLAGSASSGKAPGMCLGVPGRVGVAMGVGVPGWTGITVGDGMGTGGSSSTDGRESLWLVVGSDQVIVMAYEYCGSSNTLGGGKCIIRYAFQIGTYTLKGRCDILLSWL